MPEATAMDRAGCGKSACPVPRGGMRSRFARSGCRLILYSTGSSFVTLGLTDHLLELLERQDLHLAAGRLGRNVHGFPRPERVWHALSGRAGRGLDDFDPEQSGKGRTSPRIVSRCVARSTPPMHRGPAPRLSWAAPCWPPAPPVFPLCPSPCRAASSSLPSHPPVRAKRSRDIYPCFSAVCNPTRRTRTPIRASRGRRQGRHHPHRQLRERRQSAPTGFGPRNGGAPLRLEP
jgi:hypothetical protein